ncbi:hypothetical protein ONE63_000019 [Megalurothrips usitatus]|uniref:Uncharacterized protein n=1 Tax=Megalurothrips usitatus TaxID=439358 RepID=A0AAV7Y184_9NEOP|nr:hypothetical protein ONE63_000019 [Megalurothrips usitatus]
MVTGKHIAKVNDLFESFNGVKVVDINPPAEGEKLLYKVALTPSSPHIELWTELYDQMARWHFIGSSNITFIENWRTTMRAITYLWMDLNEENYEHLPTGHVNSDSVENFNARARIAGGHRRNPSAKDYPSAFATVLINSLTTTVKGKNCRDDNAVNSVHLGELLNAAKLIKIQVNEETIPLEETILAGEEAEDSPDDAEEEEDEVEGEDDIQPPPPPFTSDGDLHNKLQEKLGAMAGAQIAAQVVSAYMQKWNCGDCSKIEQDTP